MAIGFPVFVKGSGHPHVVQIRASLQESIHPKIRFGQLQQDVLFEYHYQNVFNNKRQYVQLDLFAKINVGFKPSKELPLFIGHSAKAALLLASYFDCNELIEVLVSAECDLLEPPPHCKIVPLRKGSGADIKAKVRDFGCTLFMHEDDLVGIDNSIGLKEWQPNSPNPQLVRIPRGTLLTELAKILKVRSFDEIERRRKRKLAAVLSTLVLALGTATMYTLEYSKKAAMERAAGHVENAKRLLGEGDAEGALDTALLALPPSADSRITPQLPELLMAIRRQTSMRCRIEGGSIGFSGKMLVTYDFKQGVRWWDSDTCELKSRFDVGISPPTQVLANTEVSRLLLGPHKGGYELFDLQKRARIGRFEGAGINTTRDTFALFAPMGKRLATHALTETGAKIGIWNTDSGRLICEMTTEGHSRVAEWSADGSNIVALSGVRSVVGWSADNCKESFRFDFVNEGIFRLVYGAGEHIILGLSATTIEAHSFRINTPVASFDGITAGMISLHPNAEKNSIVGVSHDRWVRIWSIEGGAPLASFQLPAASAADFSMGAYFSPSGKLVVAPRHNGEIVVLDAVSLQHITTIRDLMSARRFFTVDVDATDSLLTVRPQYFEQEAFPASENVWPNRARIFDIGRDPEVSRLKGQGFSDASGIFSPDNRFLITWSAQLIANTDHQGEKNAFLWRTSDGSLISKMTFPAGQGWIFDVTFTGDGSHFSTRSFSLDDMEGGAARLPINRVWNSEGGAELYTLPDDQPVFFSVPGSDLFGLIDPEGEIRFFHAGKNIAVAKIEIGPITDLPRYSFSADGSVFAVVRRTREIALYDPRNGRELKQVTATASVSTIAVDESGEQLAVATADGDIVIQDITSSTFKRMTDSGLNEPLMKLMFAYDARYLIGVDLKGNITIWDTASRKIHSKISLAGDYIASELYDRARLARTYSMTGSDSVFWSLPDGIELGRFVGDPNSATFSRDGTLYLESGKDETVVRRLQLVMSENQAIQWARRLR